MPRLGPTAGLLRRRAQRGEDIGDGARLVQVLQYKAVQGYKCLAKEGGVHKERLTVPSPSRRLQVGPINPAPNPNPSAP